MGEVCVGGRGGGEYVRHCVCVSGGDSEYAGVSVCGY